MKAVILAAGFWTRMLPITKTIPKELLPVGNKPVIQYCIEWLVDAGIKDIILITSQSKKALEDYFDKQYELEQLLEKKGKLDLLELINKPKTLANYTFIKQAEQLGTGHAVLQVEPRINDDFIVVFGDAIYPPEMFRDMVTHYQQNKAPLMVVQEVPREEVHKYGVVKIENNAITDVVEKPSIEQAPSNLIRNGVSILPANIFDILHTTPMDTASGELFLPWAIKTLMWQRSVYPLVSRPMWDIWNPESWLAANVYIAQNGNLFV